MKAIGLILCTVIGLGAVSVLAADASEKNDAAPTTQPAADKPVNTKCPVSGDDIDTKVTTIYGGKTIAFCCKDCIAEFNKNPEKYMKGLK